MYTWIITSLGIICLFIHLDIHEVAAKQPVKINIMNKYSNKLSPSLKMHLMTEGTQKSTEKLNLLLRVVDPEETTFRGQLDRIGAEIRTTAGDIITVTLSADQLSNLIDLDGVIYVEKSRPLSQED